jgi:6-phosphogluconolactonase (cycloisomerase 2 family)
MGKVRTVLAGAILAAAASTSALAMDGDLRTGAVFVMTNQNTNEIIAYDRAADGSLVEAGRFATGGRGNPIPQGNDPAVDPLASQGSLIVSENGRYVLAVNARSNNFSSLRITKTGLTPVMTSQTRGVRPISIANFSNLIYVLNESNANAVDTLAGYILGPFGRLRHLPDSDKVVTNDPSFDAGSVTLNRDGRLLVVTDKRNSQITSYKVADTGVLKDPAVVTPSNGATPFGVASDGRGHVIVAEAQGGADGAGSLSSYGIESDGSLTSISNSVANSQTASCWIAVTNDASFVYTSNTGSGQISSYSLDEDGNLDLLQSAVANLAASTAPTDIALTRDGQFLYVLAAGRRSIYVFQIGADGALDRMPSVIGLPTGVQGIAAN